LDGRNPVEPLEPDRDLPRAGIVARSIEMQRVSQFGANTDPKSYISAPGIGRYVYGSDRAIEPFWPSKLVPVWHGFDGAE
jgi:hypothetical protein